MENWTVLWMLAEGTAQLDAEQASTRHPSIWQEVYNLLRCTGPLCKKGPHCWRDPVGKRHRLHFQYLTPT